MSDRKERTQRGRRIREAGGVVPRGARQLLKAIIISLQCEEFNDDDGKTIPMGCVLDLIRHHPGLKPEIDAIQKVVDGMKAMEFIAPLKRETTG